MPASVGRTALRQQIPSWNASVLDRSIKAKVCFEQHDDVWIPLFQPVAGGVQP